MQRDAFLDRYFVHNTKLKPGRTIIYIHIIYTYKYTYNDNICWFCVLKIASQNLKKQSFYIIFYLFCLITFKLMNLQSLNPLLQLEDETHGPQTATKASQVKTVF